MSSVHGGKIVWCLLSTVAKNVVSFVHPGKNSLVSFGSGVFCPTFKTDSRCILVDIGNVSVQTISNEADIKRT